MGWRTTMWLVATIAVLLLWLLAGCAGDGSDDRSQQQQARQSEGSASGNSTRPTEYIKLDEDLNGTMVFQSAPEDGRMWAMNAHGSTPSLLTSVIPSVNPFLSPNGKKIAFTAERTEGGICTGSASPRASARASVCSPEVDYAQLHVRNTDGSGETMLLEEESAMLSGLTWSPDSKEIAFALSGATNERCTIYSMNADGLGNRSTLAEIDRCYGIHSSAWSPDGKNIALGVQRGEYGQQADIWVVNVSGGTGENNQPRQLPVNEGGVNWNNVSPTWSPDGTQIAFTHTTAPIGEIGYDTQIFKINADGSGQTRLTRDPAYYGKPTDAPIDPAFSTMHSPAWSPDGEKIAFVRGYILKEHPDPNAATTPYGSAIYVMGSDGSDPEFIKDLPLAYVQNLDWLPDHVDLPLAAPATDAAD